MSEERGPWYLLTGLVIGVVLGLGFAWFIAPGRVMLSPFTLQFGNRDTYPVTLKAEFQDGYRSLIAAAYAANQDLVRAQGRLENLGVGGDGSALWEQVERMQGSGSPSSQVEQLSALVAALEGTGSLPAILSGAPTPFSTLVITPTIGITQPTQADP